MSGGFKPDLLDTTLRVLTALKDRRDPDESDVAQLRLLAPELADAPPDELACHIILLAVRERAFFRREK